MRCQQIAISRLVKSAYAVYYGSFFHVFIMHELSTRTTKAASLKVIWHLRSGRESKQYAKSAI